MPHNRYGLPTSGDDLEALLQWQFDQHLPPSLIRTFTAGFGPVKVIFATAFTEITEFRSLISGNFLPRMGTDYHGWRWMLQEVIRVYP